MKTVTACSLLTVASIFGACLAAFWIFNSSRIRGLTSGMPQGQLVLTRMVIFLSPFFLGGGLWGAGLARLAGTRPVWPAARTGALTVGGMALLLELPVHFSQALPVWNVSFGFHILFAVVLMTEVALVAGTATNRTTRRIPMFRNETKIGRHTAVAAALGLLTASILALPLGWEVRLGNGPGMISALYLGVALSAASAGGYIGHRLAKAHHSDGLRSGAEPGHTLEARN